VRTSGLVAGRHLKTRHRHDHARDGTYYGVAHVVLPVAGEARWQRSGRLRRSSNSAFSMWGAGWAAGGAAGGRACLFRQVLEWTSYSQR